MSTSTFIDQHMSEPQTLMLGCGRAAVFSAKCPTRGDAPNQDAAAVAQIDADRALLVVADGMGGGRDGDQASRMVVESIMAAVGDRPNEENGPFGQLISAIESAHRTISDMGVGAATTVALVLIDGLTARPCHVGDSGVIITGQRGRRKLRTTAHSPVGFAEAAGLIQPDEAMHHDDRHLVSNMVGLSDMSIELGPRIDLAVRDTVILGTDGLFDNLMVDEIVERTRKGAIDRASRRLAADAAGRMTQSEPGMPGKPDDVTFILFRPHKTRQGR